MIKLKFSKAQNKFLIDRKENKEQLRIFFWTRESFWINLCSECYFLFYEADFDDFFIITEFPW